MLVLSRKLGEKIVIGNNICITVVDIDRGKIRLGIEAPHDVSIFRKELLPLRQGEVVRSMAAPAPTEATAEVPIDKSTPNSPSAPTSHKTL